MWGIKGTAVGIAAVLAAVLVLGSVGSRAEEGDSVEPAKPQADPASRPREPDFSPKQDPTCTPLHRDVHFVADAGEVVKVPGGYYRLEAVGDREIKLTAVGGSKTFLLAAQASNHEQAVEGTKATAYPIEDDQYVLGLLHEDKTALVAVGALSSEKTRGGGFVIRRLPPPTLQPGSAPIRITTPVWNAIVGDALQYSEMEATAESPDAADRYTKIFIQYPGRQSYKKFEPLHRLKVKLNTLVTQDSAGGIMYFYASDGTKLRGFWAGAQDWRVGWDDGAWSGYVEDGKLVVEIHFAGKMWLQDEDPRARFPVIKTRSVIQESTLFGWKDKTSWSDQDSDFAVPDLGWAWREAPSLLVATVRLTPIVDEYGRISYANTGSQNVSLEWPSWNGWSYVGEESYRDFDLLKPLVEKYRDEVLQVVKDRIKIAFRGVLVRDILVHVIHEHTKRKSSGRPDRIDASLSTGDTIVVKTK